jgi:hypothetical protein
MKRSILRCIVRTAVVVSALLLGACASRQVRCDRHLTPINVPHDKSTSKAHQ